MTRVKPDDFRFMRAGPIPCGYLDAPAFVERPLADREQLARRINATLARNRREEKKRQAAEMQAMQLAPG